MTIPIACQTCWWKECGCCYEEKHLKAVRQRLPDEPGFGSRIGTPCTEELAVRCKEAGAYRSYRGVMTPENIVRAVGGALLSREAETARKEISQMTGIPLESLDDNALDRIEATLDSLGVPTE